MNSPRSTDSRPARRIQALADNLTEHDVQVAQLVELERIASALEQIVKILKHRTRKSSLANERQMETKY